MSFRTKVNMVLRRYFLGGILVIVPLIITVVVLRFFFTKVDDILSPFITQAIGYKIPGLGFVATIILIFLAGFLTANVFGSRLFRMWEIFLVKTPLVRTIYSSSKKLVEAIATTDKYTFKQVVLVEFPRKGVYYMAFMTNEIKVNMEGKTQEFVSVFIPSTPTPFTGWTLLFHKDEIIPLEMTVEDGVKFFVSGGIASPPMFSQKHASEMRKID
jgi:uncharacterized membrane protein